MNQDDLQSVVPGFDDPVTGSQALFRLALQALSLPGRVLDVPRLSTLPPLGHGAAAQLLLALLDSDCTLWLSDSLRGSPAEAWLRFHTGCRCVGDASQARFLWLAAGDRWPSLDALNAGTDEYPDQSATCVMEVASLQALDAPENAVLEGPGIPTQQPLQARGLPPDFAAQWQANHAAFPRGVDVFLATTHQLLGLPRSTRLTQPQPQEA